jgi:hypothetical protein
MHRFALVAGIALLCLPANAARRFKPPVISVCFDKVCLVWLHWDRPEVFGSSLPSISGTLTNDSTLPLSTISLTFNLASAGTLTGTASAFFFGQIPPGASWSFNAYFREYEGSSIVTRNDSGSFEGVATDSVGPRHFFCPSSLTPCSISGTGKNARNGS